MRLVNIAHGDLIVSRPMWLWLSARAPDSIRSCASIIVVPVMFALGYALAARAAESDAEWRTVAAAAGHLRHFDHHPERAAAGLRRLHHRLQEGAIETASLQFPGGISIGVYPLVVFAVALLALASLQLLFYRTGLGRAFRAVSDDADTAELMGIDNRKLYAVALGIAMIFTALAGVLFGIRTNFDPASGPIRLILAFEAVIIGGLGSMWGTLIGGVVLGLAQSSARRCIRLGKSSPGIWPFSSS